MTAIQDINAGGNCFTESVNTLYDMKTLMEGYNGSKPLLRKLCVVLDKLRADVNHGKSRQSVISPHYLPAPSTCALPFGSTIIAFGPIIAYTQSVICSMESRFSSFSGTRSKTRRDGERLNICYFAPDHRRKSRILVDAPKDQMSTV